MSDNTTSVDPYIDDLSDDVVNEITPLDFGGNVKNLDSRRRLEEKLAQRSLEKDVREFDFDI